MFGEPVDLTKNSFRLASLFSELARSKGQEQSRQAKSRQDLLMAEYRARQLELQNKRLGLGERKLTFEEEKFAKGEDKPFHLTGPAADYASVVEMKRLSSIPGSGITPEDAKEAEKGYNYQYSYKLRSKTMQMDAMVQELNAKIAETNDLTERQKLIDRRDQMKLGFIKGINIPAVLKRSVSVDVALNEYERFLSNPINVKAVTAFAGVKGQAKLKWLKYKQFLPGGRTPEENKLYSAWATFQDVQTRFFTDSMRQALEASVQPSFLDAYILPMFDFHARMIGENAETAAIRMKATGELLRELKKNYDLLKVGKKIDMPENVKKTFENWKRLANDESETIKTINNVDRKTTGDVNYSLEMCRAEAKRRGLIK